MTKEDMLTLMATQVEHYTRRIVNLEADFKKWCNEAGAANDRVRKLEPALARAEARIAELEAALAERDARPVPANPYTVVVSELGATTAPDACPHAEGTKGWAQSVAKAMGVCVKRRAAGNYTWRWHDGTWKYWNQPYWCNPVSSVTYPIEGNMNLSETGWRIVDNPEAGQ
jgi:hypothetical protein